MIVFDLRCADGHVFEAWFASGAAFDEQRERGLVRCAFCDSTDVGKALMAPNLAVNSTTPDPDLARKMLAKVAAVQAKLLKNSAWVGDGFAQKARAMHAGDEPHASIHGRATASEARELAEDGVPVAPLLVPVVPPEERH